MESFVKNQAKDLRCIWMAAGIVNYKLCEQNFQCESCEFHRVMRGALPHEFDHLKPGDDWPNGLKNPPRPVEAGSKHTDEKIRQYLDILFSGCKIRLDCCYHPTHFWCQQVEMGRVLIGFDPVIAQILNPVERIFLPEVGKTYRKHQLIAWVLRKKKPFPLYSPLEGAVTQVNSALARDGFASQVFADRYFFKMEGDDLAQQLQQFPGNMAGLQWYLQKIGNIREFLANAIRQNFASGVEMTLADGGAPEFDLEKVLGEQTFQEMVKNLFYRK